MAHPHTTIITSQPVGTVAPAGMIAPRDWSSGLCSCLDDVPSCVTGFCCPAIMECWLADSAGECMCLPCVFPASTIAIRTKVRTENNIRGTIFNDCLMFAFCPICVMTQTKREIDYIKQGRV